MSFIVFKSFNMAGHLGLLQRGFPTWKPSTYLNTLDDLLDRLKPTQNTLENKQQIISHRVKAQWIYILQSNVFGGYTEIRLGFKLKKQTTATI
jgi:hypothetical protein